MRSGEGARRFRNREVYDDFQIFLEAWDGGKESIKSVFLQLLSTLLELPEAELDFLERPGVSYSLRAERRSEGDMILFALVDVVDDDPGNRWLSVCFYADAVSDPQELGNLIPGGILGKDGYCFDVFKEDASLFKYLVERIREAYKLLSDNRPRQ